MKPLAGRVFGLLGALQAVPFRAAVAQVERQGGRLRRGNGRGVTTVVFGRKALHQADTRALEQRFDALIAERRRPVGEAGFLRRLGLIAAASDGIHPRALMIDNSGLNARTFDLLALFDAFEKESEPFTFRDLILARKYRALIECGAGWDAIARAVHRVPEVGGLSALSLDVEARAIIARRGDWHGELDGQGRLALGSDGPEADETFEAAEEAEAAGDAASAAALYARCLAIDPRDAVAAFNRGNCLRVLGNADEAAQDYARAVKHDPAFVEAWFNFASLRAEQGHPESARRYLQRALALDPTYADAAFNLARLDYEAGRLIEARAGWQRYLELDRDSEWAQRARNGLQLIAISGAR